MVFPPSIPTFGHTWPDDGTGSNQVQIICQPPIVLATYAIAGDSTKKQPNALELFTKLLMKGSF